MNIFMTEYDVQVVFRAALTRTAKCLEIVDIYWKANQELYDEIEMGQSDLVNPLDNFLDSYRKWYQYHFDRKDQSDFNDEERQELSKLMERRDTSRKDLIDILQSKGC
jgi:hypothetical protein